MHFIFMKKNQYFIKKGLKGLWAKKLWQQEKINTAMPAWQ